MNQPGPRAKVGTAHQSIKLQSASLRGVLWCLFASIGRTRQFLSLALCIVIGVGTLSCNKKKFDMAKLGLNIDSSYMMRTEGIDMLVSDSGVTKYRLLSPMWLVYDNKDKREWYFPQGLKLEGYDTINPSELLILADTARYIPDVEEWQLWGNVRIHGPKGERLYTPRLYWLKKDRRMYSNDTTYFLTQGRELHGERFEAKDDLSTYSIYNNSGSVEYEEQDEALSHIP